jgi:hypothetical protein
MAHFAEIDSENKVIRVLVVPDDQQDRGQDFLAVDLGLGGTWIQTSYNTRHGVHLAGGTPLRKNFARIGYVYDPVSDAFIESKPTRYPSWILDDAGGYWKPPVSYPTDGKKYIWDEANIRWKLFSTK